MPRIGIIEPGAMWGDHFRQALRDLGYVEGRNIAIEYRSAEAGPERLVAATTELAQLQVDVIVTFGSPATQAAKQATTTIPIVMAGIGDPVRAGFVASLAHPGGNITGNTILGPEVAAKRLQLLKLAVPTISRVAILWNPDNPSHAACTNSGNTWLLGGSCHTARASPICPEALPATCTRFCKARGPPTCPCSSRPSST